MENDFEQCQSESVEGSKNKNFGSKMGSLIGTVFVGCIAACLCACMIAASISFISWILF